MAQNRNTKKANLANTDANNATSKVTSIHKLTKAKCQTVGIALLLAVVTVVIYSGVFKNDFDYYDDEYYVTTNDHVLHGLSWEGVKWAFTSVGYADNWHPLTWLSHMLDVQLFGLNPAGHHFTNVFFHIFATLLLFGFMRYTTREIGIAAFVTVLFALHPMHVESVAWVAERKDVLSAVFWFASLLGYAYYVRSPGLGRYTAVLLLFAIGLLAKPMLVSLPFVLLLLDYWPLGRMTVNLRTFSRLVVEKLPFFLTTAASSIITIIAQHRAIGGLDKFNIATRLSNAIVSYGIYISQVFWPTKLAVFYPFTRPYPIKVMACALLLIMITTAMIWIGMKKKYLITGWLWYIVTLIPVIGIVQVGSQAHADRYTYIPYIGIFIIIAYGIKDLTSKMPSSKKNIVNIALIVILLAMAIQTREQVRFWKNGVTLFSHTIDVTNGNEIAYYNLGNVLLQDGRTDEAIIQYKKALKINPNKINTLSNLAGAYYQKKQFSDAMPLMQRALLIAKASCDEARVKEIGENIERLNQTSHSIQQDLQ